MIILLKYVFNLFYLLKYKNIESSESACSHNCFNWQINNFNFHGMTFYFSWLINFVFVNKNKTVIQIHSQIAKTLLFIISSDKAQSANEQLLIVKLLLLQKFKIFIRW